MKHKTMLFFPIIFKFNAIIGLNSIKKLNVPNLKTVPKFYPNRSDVSHGPSEYIMYCDTIYFKNLSLHVLTQSIILIY